MTAKRSTDRHLEQKLRGPEPATEFRDATRPGAGSDRLFESGEVADYAGFVVSALRRRKVLAAGTFVSTLALAALALAAWPRTYYVEVKLLAQRNQVMTALSNPGRAIPWDADAPTRSAAETVLRRDNLVSLIKQTDLVNQWERTRSPAYRIRDGLNRLFRRRPTEAEKIDALVVQLERRMIVAADEGTVTIVIYWPDARLASQLVETAQQNFLEARQIAETSAITESISILERYAATLHKAINLTATELQESRARGARTLREAGSRAPRREASTPDPAGAAVGETSSEPNPDVDPELARVKTALEAKRQEVANLEDFRRRQLSELQARLAQWRTVYTDEHPSLLNLRQNIADLSHESPQLIALRAQENALEAEYERRVIMARVVAADAGVKAPSASPARRRGAVSPPRLPAVLRDLPGFGGETPDYATLRFRLELTQLANVLERIDGARIELATSQAAFKYRYTVIRPAQVPTDPIKPNVPAVLGASILGAVLLAIAAAVGRDIVGGRILHPWQIRRQLSVPVLVHLSKP